MPSKPKKTERTHPGLCLDLLDDDHKRLIRELAFLLMRASNLQKPRVQFGAAGSPMAQCPSCLECVWLADAKMQTLDSAVLIHAPDCLATHCSRLLDADLALRLLAFRELEKAETESGVAYAQETAALRARVKSLSESSTDSVSTREAQP